MIEAKCLLDSLLRLSHLISLERLERDLDFCWLLDDGRFFDPPEDLGGGLVLYLIEQCFVATMVTCLVFAQLLT